jgi:hypothetical protein
MQPPLTPKAPVPVIRVPTPVGAGVAVAPPVLMGEVQVREIRPGSVLTVTTQTHIYTINVNEAGHGMLMTNNEQVKNGPVILHGSWDYDSSMPVWGWLSRGKGLLFAHLPDIRSATRTSPVVKISLTRKGH